MTLRRLNERCPQQSFRGYTKAGERYNFAKILPLGPGLCKIDAIDNNDDAGSDLVFPRINPPELGAPFSGRANSKNW